MTPDLFVIWMVEKLAMFEGLYSGCIEYREGPVIDEIIRVLAACIYVGCEGKARSISVGHWLGRSRRHKCWGRKYRRSQGNGGMCCNTWK